MTCRAINTISIDRNRRRSRGSLHMRCVGPATSDQARTRDFADVPRIGSCLKCAPGVREELSFCPEYERPVTIDLVRRESLVKLV